MCQLYYGGVPLLCHCVILTQSILSPVTMDDRNCLHSEETEKSIINAIKINEKKLQHVHIQHLRGCRPEGAYSPGFAWRYSHDASSRLAWKYKKGAVVRLFKVLQQPLPCDELSDYIYNMLIFYAFKFVKIRSLLMKRNYVDNMVSNKVSCSFSALRHDIRFQVNQPIYQLVPACEYGRDRRLNLDCTYRK